MTLITKVLHNMKSLSDDNDNRLVRATSVDFDFDLMGVHAAKGC